MERNGRVCVLVSGKRGRMRGCVKVKGHGEGCEKVIVKGRGGGVCGGEG